MEEMFEKPDPATCKGRVIDFNPQETICPDIFKKEIQISILPLLTWWQGNVPVILDNYYTDLCSWPTNQ